MPAALVIPGGGAGSSRPSLPITGRVSSCRSRHQVTSVMSPNVHTITRPVPLAGSARRCARIGTGTPNSGVRGRRAEQRACTARRRDARPAPRRQAAARAWLSPRRPRPEGRRGCGAHPVPGPCRGEGKRQPDERAWRFAVLDLGLCHRGAERHVPQRRRLCLVGLAAGEVAQEGELGDSLHAVVDGPVAEVPVHRQAEPLPRLRVRGLVQLGELPAQLHEVAPGDGQLIGWTQRAAVAQGWRREAGLVRQGRVAADAVVVLDAAFGGQAVVVPPDRVEDLLAAHALEARDDVGLAVGEGVPEVQRSAGR